MPSVSVLTPRTLHSAVIALCASDEKLSRIVERHGHPPMWAREPGFATLVRIILEQQVSLKSAETLYLRVERAIGAFTPDIVLAGGELLLRENGLTRQKASYVVALASRVADGSLPLQAMSKRSDDEVMQLLMQVPGIGAWSAGVYLLMALRRADVWPPGDLALHIALQRVHGLAARPTRDEALHMASQWSPWRAVAARILWHGYLQER